MTDTIFQKRMLEEMQRKAFENYAWEFIHNWGPHDHTRAAQFSAELFAVVMGTWAEHAKQSNAHLETLTKLIEVLAKRK